MQYILTVHGLPIFIFRGHRAESFIADVNELVEVRARQRTFNGAYARTALGNLGYSLTILKLFDRRFYRSAHFLIALAELQPSTYTLVLQPVGLLYAVLAALLFVCSYLRSRHSQHDFADKYKPSSSDETCDGSKAQTQSRPLRIIKTKGQENKQNFGRPFVTAGWIVLAVAGVVAAVEIALLVLILKS